MSGRVTDILDELDDLAKSGDEVSVGDVMDKVGHRSSGVFLLVPGLIGASPLGGIPTLPSLMAAIVLIFAVQTAIGRKRIWMPAAIREHWRGRLAAEGAPALHRLLAERDPVAASRIAPADGQRIVRALEVGEASGRALSALQAGRGEGPL